VITRIALALLCTIGGVVSAADDIPIPGGPLEMGGVIWKGPEDSLPQQLIAERAAPILWFSPDEPLLFESVRPFPSRLPCDQQTTEPVVYFRIARAIGRGKDESLAGPLDPIPLAKVRSLDLVYYFYYLKDIGGGCHVNDLESALFRIQVEDEGPFVLRITQVMGAAHGHLLYSNELDLRRGSAGRDASLPITLLIEEGKHATCPDRNADGRYTPGYDVNRLATDAWGIRDVFGTGLVGRSSYEASMTKTRAPAGRLGPRTQRPALWAQSERSGLGPPDADYLLRPVPADCGRYRDEAKAPGERCRRMSLANKMRDEHFGEPPELGTASLWSKVGAVLKQIPKSFSVRAQEGFRYLGYSVILPISADLPLFGGYVGIKASGMVVERRPKVDNWRSLSARERQQIFEDRTQERGWFRAYPATVDYTFTYTPSRARRVDWYGSAGVSATLSFDDLRFSGWRPTLEGGLQLRQQVEAIKVPFFVLSVGAQWRDARGWSSVVEIRLGAYSGGGQGQR
jgi:hypothetical protein